MKNTFKIQLEGGKRFFLLNKGARTYLLYLIKLWLQSTSASVLEKSVDWNKYMNCVVMKL